MEEFIVKILYSFFSSIHIILIEMSSVYFSCNVKGEMTTYKHVIEYLLKMAVQNQKVFEEFSGKVLDKCLHTRDDI